VILAAALLVLLGLGLFVAGVLTGTTALYWGCVAACVVAAVLLVAARRQLTAVARTAEAADADPTGATATTAAGRRTSVPSATTDRPARGIGAPANADATEPPEPAEGTGPAAGASAAGVAATARPGEHTAPEGLAAPGEEADPGVEDVEVTDLLLVLDLKDEVLVVDEHPRYHVAGCSWLRGRTTIPLPLDEARTDGFTPCAVCTPDRTLAEQVRARRAAGSS